MTDRGGWGRPIILGKGEVGLASAVVIKSSCGHWPCSGEVSTVQARFGWADCLNVNVPGLLN